MQQQPVKEMLAAKQSGDTLVEVLIAIAVVSLILGGAYATTNRSLMANRAAQERGIALKLAESQIEQLKAAAATPGNTVYTVTSPFCMTASGPVAASSPQCRIDQPPVGEPVFTISIARNSATHTFTLTETWQNVSGHQTDRLNMVYRVYE